MCRGGCNPRHGAVSVSLSPRRLNIYQGRLIYFLLINTIMLSLAPPRPGWLGSVSRVIVRLGVTSHRSSHTRPSPLDRATHLSCADYIWVGVAMTGTKPRPRTPGPSTGREDHEQAVAWRLQKAENLRSPREFSFLKYFLHRTGKIINSFIWVGIGRSNENWKR